MPDSKRQIDRDGLEARIAAFPGAARVRAAAAEAGVAAYLVGGSVRDALLARGPTELDVAVDGDHLALVDALGFPATKFERFATATVHTPEGPIDIAATRAESYESPGALPAVRAASLDADLGRRDFTVNAIAVPAAGEFRLIDPHGGVADLEAGVLRVLHDSSFIDDPTRALRAARYASRLGLEPAPATLELLRASDLTTVSGDRVEAELRKIAGDERPRTGFELLGEWGLIELSAGAGERIERIAALAAAEPWSGLIGPAAAVLAAIGEPTSRSEELAAALPERPSAGVALARGVSPAELIVARSLGGEWLDDYVGTWRSLRLTISGADLLAAGVSEGPAVGRGLAAALQAKLDGESGGREDELEIALRAAR